MDKAALVSVDVESGARLVKALDEAKLKVRVALWFFSPEYEDWRFVLASRRLDEASPLAAYGMVHDALTVAGITLRETPPLMIMRVDDSFVRELRRLFGKTKDVEGMRLGGQLIGDRFVEDAYVYRIA